MTERKVSRCFPVILLAITLRAQAPLSFEVASVKPSGTMPAIGKRTQLNRDPGRINYSFVALGVLIEKAYGLKSYQVSAPEWVRMQAYDVVATFPADTTDEQLREMLQTLLKERFKMEAHREERPLPVYELAPGKGGFKGKPAEQSRDLRFSIAGPGRKLSGAATIDSLAITLSAMLDRPVVDSTGISGNYEIDLEYAPDEREAHSIVGMKMAHAVAQGDIPAPSDAAGGPSISTVLQDRLGLKLEPKKAPVQFLVIDKIEKAPVEN